MEENIKRKLHPALEILIIAAILFVFGLITGAASTLLFLVIDPDDLVSILPVYNIASTVISCVAVIFAAWLCVKVIEKRSIHMVALCLICLGVEILISIMSFFISNFSATFGGAALAIYSYASRILFPILKAVLITLFVNLFDKDHVDS